MGRAAQSSELLALRVPQSELSCSNGAIRKHCRGAAITDGDTNAKASSFI